jgi:hypothetical protein
LILYPDIRILDININNSVFLSALSLSASLPNKSIDANKNITDTNKIILIDCKDNYIVIMRNIIVVKTDNVINILEDKKMSIFHFVITKLPDSSFNEIKYFLEVAEK